MASSMSPAASIACRSTRLYARSPGSWPCGVLGIMLPAPVLVTQEGCDEAWRPSRCESFLGCRVSQFAQLERVQQADRVDVQSLGDLPDRRRPRVFAFLQSDDGDPRDAGF